ncbi:hypothetical protein D9M70_596710 [compost metagenome]
MPKLTGTAISMATPALTSVPNTGTKAPNSRVPTFHSVLVKKPRPKVCRASRPPHSIDSAAATKDASTNMPAPVMVQRNSLSARASRVVRISDSEAGRAVAFMQPGR